MSKKIVKGEVSIIGYTDPKKALFHIPNWEYERIERLAGVNADQEENYLIVQISESGTKYEKIWESDFGSFQAACDVPCPEQKGDGYIIGYFPKYLPMKIFKNKKEGDKIELYCPEYEIIIELTCNQLGYDWHEKPVKFQEALRKAERAL